MSVQEHNRLQNESSAYLKQHQSNPVKWWPYGPEALQYAQDEEKPIFLSIGYSSCHWCHIMAHESFEDRTTANFLNENFVNIKIDREELPDLDQYFQLACQVMNGKGGWPLSVFLTSEMKPFFIGTYFPSIAKDGMPSFMEVLENLSKAYTTERATIEKNADEIMEAIKQAPKVDQKVEFEGHYPAPASILNALKNYQDEDFGGYGTEPKFPHYAFLEWAVEHMLEGVVPEEFGKHILDSIEKMLMGGIYDHARGGIHRYSVDKKWAVPHFEKMLYDQAGLLRVLAKVSLIYPSPLIFDALIQTLDYLKNEMLSDKGYFFAAQDADSEGMEGLYFAFTKDEFIDALVQLDEELTDDLETLLLWFNITEEGNFERKLNVISLNPKYKEDFYTPEGWSKVRKVRQALLEDRRMRIPPATDNKGIASWNFQLVSALIDVVQYCKVDSIALSASELVNEVVVKIHNTFVKQDSETQKSRIITSTTREGHIPLFEDYVMFCESQFRFYEISGNESFKESAIQTLDFIFKEFYKDGLFLTRALSFNDSERYENLHVPIFDQSFKAPIGTLFGLIRKWKTSLDLRDYSDQIQNSIDTITHLSLQNPLAFGETLRALVYPDEAYRKIEVPKNWLTTHKFTPFFPHFSVRFALNYTKEENNKWQVCTLKECELTGTSFEEFETIFKNQES